MTNGCDPEQRCSRLIKYLDKEIVEITDSITRIESTIQDRKNKIEDLKSTIDILNESNKDDEKFIQKLKDDREDFIIELEALNKHFKSLEDEGWF